MDLARLLTFKRATLTDWSDETKLILQHLGVDPVDGWRDLFDGKVHKGFASDVMIAVHYAGNFGMDVMEGIGATDPQFYSLFNANRFLTGGYMEATATRWQDHEDIVSFG